MGNSNLWFRRLILRRGAVLLYLFVLLSIIALFAGLQTFRSPRNLTNLVLRSVPLLAVSLGQTIVLITAGIDLSVGAVLALTTTIASVTMRTSILGGTLLALGAGAVVGLVNGLAVIKLRVNPFLVTLSTTIIVGGIALFIRPYPGGHIPTRYLNFVMATVGIVPIMPLLFFIVLVAIGSILLRQSVFGRHLYAVGGNREAARLAGINTTVMVVAAYMWSSVFATLGGLYMTARISSGDPAVGAPFQMESITAAVIGGAALTGGRGGAIGTMFGVVLVVLIGNVFNLLGIDIYWQQVIRGLILLSVVGFSQFSIERRKRLKQKKITT